MTHRECPHCHQTLPREHALPDVYLTPGQRSIYERVRKAGAQGVPRNVLFDFLYDKDPNGGPLSERHCLYVRVNHLNRKIRKAGLEISANRPGNLGEVGNYVLRVIR